VNVHPTKAEVRFLEQSLVHEVVRRALGDALGQGRAPELQLRPGEPGGPSALEPGLPGVVAGAGLAGSRWAPITSVFARPGQPEGSAAAMTSTGPSTVDADPFARSVQGAMPDIRPMTPLGQFRDTFIIAVDDEGIAIVDQHVAHERVLFEQVMERLTSGAPRVSACSCPSSCSCRPRSARS